MAISLIGLLILVLVAAVYYGRHRIVPLGKKHQVGADVPQSTDYSGSVGGIILIGMFGLGYVLAIVFVVIGLMAK